ncbi:MAG: type 1 glutamine amidotransferase [Pirellulaceae bacterium]|jgi:type 1 glutamine amidotransferase
MLRALTSGLLVLAMMTGMSTAEEKTKLKGLLICGGCCHDYTKQKLIVTEGISQRVSISWDIIQGGGGRNEKLEIYGKKDWSKGYDIVVHNECYGGVEDVKFVENIVKGHTETGIPAIVIHCSMHTYRAAQTDEWRKFLGVTSRRHEKGGRQLDVTLKAKDHPIMNGFPAKWKTPNGELYVIENVWPKCTVLATAYGEDTKMDQPVVWANQYGKAKIFGTTLGHHNETMLDEVWLDMVSRGVLWSLDKLGADGKPIAGYEGTGKAPFSFDKTDGPKPTPAKK